MFEQTRPEEETIPRYLRMPREVFIRAEMLLRHALFVKWKQDSRRHDTFSLASSEKVSVIIPAYASVRRRNIEPMVRWLLQCTFVQKVIVSNNNPETDIEADVAHRDARLELINQPLRRGPGMVWQLGYEMGIDNLVVIDDDTLIHPSQLARVVDHLFCHQAVPHGIAGRNQSKYVISREAEVSCLYNLYAVTREHLRRFLDLQKRLCTTEGVTPETIEFLSDDIVISRSGRGPALIHDVGYVLFCRSFIQPGVAIHTERHFDALRSQVSSGLDRIMHAEDQV